MVEYAAEAAFSWLLVAAAPLIFMLPEALANTYLGLRRAQAMAGSEGLIGSGLIALALLAAVALTARADHVPAAASANGRRVIVSAHPHPNQTPELGQHQ